MLKQNIFQTVFRQQFINGCNSEGVVDNGQNLTTAVHAHLSTKLTVFVDWTLWVRHKRRSLGRLPCLAGLSPLCPFHFGLCRGWRAKQHERTVAYGCLSLVICLQTLDAGSGVNSALLLGHSRRTVSLKTMSNDGKSSIKKPFTIDFLVQKVGCL